MNDIDPQALADLLARAVALEEKAGAMTDTAVADPSLSLDAIAARVQGLEQTILDLATGPAGDAETEDEMDFTEGVEDPFLTGAAEQVDVPIDQAPSIKSDYVPCFDCGSADVDEFKDGRSVCGVCGSDVIRQETKVFDFEDDGELPDELLEGEEKVWDELGLGDEPAEVEVKSAEVITEELDEIELLLARRASL